jgi:predicted nucleic acid-binding protein
MIEFKKVFIDTSPFIYLLEDHEEYADQVANFIKYCTTNDIVLSTSVITHMEFCVKPYQLNRHDVITAFEELLTELDISLVKVTQKVADTAAKLRSKYKGLKGMDALQISAAINSKCDHFMTNDRRLKQIDEISIMLINDWSH